MHTAHLLALAGLSVARRLDETKADLAQIGRGHTRHERPIYLARLLVPDRCGERARDFARARQQQNAGRVLVEAVHEARFLVIAELQRLGEAIDMAGLLGAALRRQARRLVQRDDVVVPEQNAVTDHLGIVIRHLRLGPRCDLARRRDRRNTHFVAGLQPEIRLHPPAIDAQLALAAHLLDPALRKMRKQPLQPAVQPLVPVAGADGECLHTAHCAMLRARMRPRRSAPSDSTTEAST